MTPICLYHRSDLDGKCSGYLVKRFIPDCELLGIEYGDEIDWSRLERRLVYLVDFSLQPWSEMERLADMAANVIWIDHHKSAIEEYEQSGMKLDGLREIGKAACELTWKFFSKWDIPKVVWLLGRYDVWDLDADETILPFQMGMRLDRWDPDKDLGKWNALLRGGPANAICAGRTVLQYQQNQHLGLMRKSFVHEWKGLRFLAVNAGGLNSKAFESEYDSTKHDAVMGFYFDGAQGNWTVSMYSPDQSRDLSGLAKAMGGGGHAAACGFQVTGLEEIGL